MFVGLPGAPERRAAGHGRSAARTLSAGQDPAAIEHTEVLPWNDLDAVEARLARGDVAAVITEPLWRGYIRPDRATSPASASSARRHGHHPDLRRDRVRASGSARAAARQLFGVTPDLTTFAKAMANGFPISAVAGRRDLMSLLGGGPVVHPGTYNGNALVDERGGGDADDAGRRHRRTRRSSAPAAA